MSCAIRVEEQVAMQLLSGEFAGFVALVVTAYFLFPKMQGQLLLVASLAFYLYQAPLANYVLLTYFMFVFALLIRRKSLDRKRERVILAAITAIALLPLLVTKYFDNLLPFAFEPVGVSFLSFMLVSYIYSDFAKFDEIKLMNIGQYLGYIFFFPHVVSGPIDAPNALITQLGKRSKFQLANIRQGSWQILLGVFQKAVIGNHLGQYVGIVYKNVEMYQGWPLLLAVVFFSFQLYADFMGYSNIALGLARLLGIEITINFRRPYLSISVGEFWRRWHISLSNWLRDKIYFPLGGSRVSKFRNYLNLLAVFLISGIWHGDTLTFVVWGGLHGLVVSLEKLIGMDKWKSKLLTGVRTLITYVFVTLSWVLFSFKTLPEAWRVYELLANPALYRTGLTQVFESLDLLMEMEIGLGLIVVLVGYELLAEYAPCAVVRLRHNTIIQLFVLSTMVMAILFLGIFTNQSFYYAQF